MTTRVRPTGPAAAGNGAKDFGGQLRHARQRTGFSVRGLARHIGISASHLSQLERGRAMPSVATLCAIANQLELYVDDLFRDSGAHQLQPTRIPEAFNPVQGPHNRKAIHLSEGLRLERLTRRSRPEVQFLYVVYEAGAESCEKEALIRHGGEEYAYLISGRLGVTIGFEEFELGPGDSIAFDAQTPHRLWTVGDEPAEAIWVLHKCQDNCGRRAT